MSHSAPDQVFGYNNPNVNYCYDEPESYVADYPDTDAMSESSHVIAPSNVTTELYRRKACSPNAGHPEQYRRGVYVPSNYYYDPFRQCVHPPVRRTVIYRRSYPMVDETGRYFPMPIDDHFRDHDVYSAPHIRASRRQPVPHSAPRIPRRQHVAVKTPRYFRRTMTNAVKKPSTLCLPVLSQPDPAGYRRNRKQYDEASYHYQIPKHQSPKELSRRHSVPMQQPISEHDPKEVHMTQSDVDAVLARYDTIFQGRGLESPSEKCESECSKVSYKIKMVPKIPPSIKRQQEKLQKFSKNNSAIGTTNRPKTSPKMDNLEVEEITPEVLDSMLYEMMDTEKKQKEAQKKEGSSKDNEQNLKNADHANGVNDGANQCYQSFNYQDISSNMAKTEMNNFNKPNNTASVFTAPLPRTPQFDSLKQHVLDKKNSSSESEDNGILELHRSKTYILNLIDRALSKELGTSPDEIYQSMPKEVNNNNTKEAAYTVRKHDPRCPNGPCFEITQAQGDSFVPKSTAPSLQNESKQDYSCTCNVQDEPIYIKQLRQLRWGHLKHIQMEVRRLEDLERFLDSCTTPSSQ